MHPAALPLVCFAAVIAAPARLYTLNIEYNATLIIANTQIFHPMRILFAF
jgi:hypothetical protein